jgi:hypothetical protein
MLVNCMDCSTDGIASTLFFNVIKLIPKQDLGNKVMLSRVDMFRHACSIFQACIWRLY